MPITANSRGMYCTRHPQACEERRSWEDERFKLEQKRRNSLTPEQRRAEDLADAQRRTELVNRSEALKRFPQDTSGSRTLTVFAISVSAMVSVFGAAFLISRA